MDFAHSLLELLAAIYTIPCLTSNMKVNLGHFSSVHQWEINGINLLLQHVHRGVVVSQHKLPLKLFVKTICLKTYCTVTVSYQTMSSGALAGHE